MPDPTNGVLEQKIKGLERALYESRHAEKRLHEKEKLLQSLVQSSRSINIVYLDTAYHYLFFNDVHKEAVRFAWAAEIVLGTNYLDYISNEEDRAAAQRNFERALTGETFSCMQELGNIERRYWESIYCPVIHENGQVNGLSVYATDITDRKQTQDNLLKNQYYLTKAQEIGKMGTWELNIQKNILIWPCQKNARNFG